MTKRQAKRMAYKIAADVVANQREVDLDAGLDEVSERDAAKVIAALEEISDALYARRDALDRTCR